MIFLMQDGKQEEVLALSRLKAKTPLAELEQRLRELNAYARNKADGFIAAARKEEKQLNRYAVIYAIILIGVTFFFALMIINGITSNLDILRKTISDIVDTGVFKHASIKGSNEIAELAKAFNDLLDKLHDQFWLREGYNGLNQELSGCEGLKELSELALSYLARYVGACTGVCHVWNKESQECRLIASYAYVERKYLSNVFKPGEGVVGQVAFEQRPILLENIMVDEALGRTGTVSEAPRNIYAFPLIYNGELQGVIELATFSDLESVKVEFLDQAGKVIANMMHATKQSEAIHSLLEQTREANAALEARTGELDTLNNELADANRELEVQSQELQSQALELRAQKTELETKRAQIEEADRLKSEFLSNMSHELRTPLNSILALSQLMINRGTGQDTQKEKQYLEIIDRNGQHLLSLINDILDLTKIESGRMEVFRETFSTNVVVEESLQTMQPIARNKGIGIEREIEADVWLHSDKAKFSQILLNLLSNAIKFTDQGQITVTVEQRADQARFIVQDTGIGIDSEEMHLIFDEFRQADGSTTRRHDGTGLGLAICKKLANLLGGDITAQSTKGEGSTFTLTLPSSPVEELEEGENSPPPLLKFKGSALEKTILVIDDDQSVCDSIRGHLERSGFDVVATTSPGEGLALARQLKPYAITLDLLMPEQDGWEVLGALKADSELAGIPVVIISVSDERDTGFALGASGYLLKPVDPDLLMAFLNRVVPGEQKKSVLLVDDDPAVLVSLKAFLMAKDFEVRQAENGQEALNSIAETLPNVVVLDLIMPEMDGFEVIKKVRSQKETRHLPIIVLSAKDLTREEVLLLDETVRKVLRKDGLNKEELYAQIDAALLQAPETRVKSPGGEPHIVIIEDDSVAALQMKVLLADHGYVPHVVLDSVNALNILKQSKPDGVILDLMMPEKDGFETLEVIRTLYPDKEVPVLVLTAKDLTADDRERLQSLNVRYLVRKGSLGREQLIEVIHSVFKTSGKQPVLEKGAALSQAPVLLVEDNADNQVTLAAILQDARVPFLLAENGEKAIRMAAAHTVSLILMDIQLPGINGLEATQAIKAAPATAHLPIIAMTAKAMRGDREEILQAGCDDYLSKPINPTAFVEMITKWRGKHAGQTG